MKKLCFVVAFLALFLPVGAQSGLLITKTGGDTQLMTGREYSFENINQMKYGAIKYGAKSILLSEIDKIEPFPLEIAEGSAEDYLTPPEPVGLQFVGAWEGAKHTIGTISTPHQGIWEFHNDGTFSWTGTDVKGHDISGVWKYDSNTNTIVTDALSCPALTVVSVFDDMILVKNETYNQMYTLSRVSSPSVEVSLNSPHITLFRPDGFVVRVSFVNHHFINQPGYRYGICYSLSTNPGVFENVYAATCGKIGIPELGGDWNGIVYYYDNLPVIGGDVCLSGFNIGDKLTLRPFVEFSDGNIVYGEDLKVKVIDPPSDGLFLGEELYDGKAAFWYSRGLTSNGYNFSYTMSPMKPGEADAVIQKLGDGWEIPSYIPKIFRYKLKNSSSTKEAELNIYSPINNVSSLYSFACIDKGYYGTTRSFFVKVGSTYYCSYSIIYSDSVEFGETLSSTEPSTFAYVIPCKRIEVTW